jgi:hypothetical protein
VGARKGVEEGIALRIDLAAVVRAEGFSQDGSVVGQQPCELVS